MNIGADDYIMKPFDIDDLLVSIQTRLKKKDVAAREVEDLRLNISSMIPHEMRTPLTVIQGYASLLADPEFLGDQKSIINMAQTIGKTTARLFRMVENYILYTRLKLYDQGSQKLAMWTEVGLLTANMVSDVVHGLANSYDRSGDVELNLDITELLVVKEAFIKAIQEILDNSLKFSEPGSPIKVQLYDQDKHVCCCIQDEGSGMSPEQQAKVQAFMQFDRQMQEQQGSGLGLMIAMTLAAINEGKIEINSIKNGGTEVTLTFCNLSAPT